MTANGRGRGSPAGTLARLKSGGPRLHQYPTGDWTIQYVGANKLNRPCIKKQALGRRTPEDAQQELEIFKVRLRANGDAPPATLPAVLRPRGRPRINHDAAGPLAPTIPRDTTKAVLGLVATHLLNTLAHTVKLLQEADDA